MHRRSHRSGRSRLFPSARNARNGTATVELALSLPVMAAVVFGTLEACTMLYVTQGLEIAAYESVRLAIRRDAYQRQPGQSNVMTNDQVIAHANAILAERGISDAEVTINHGDITTLAQGTPIMVTVTAPTDANRMMPAWFWDAPTLTAFASMAKE